MNDAQQNIGGLEKKIEDLNQEIKKLEEEVRLKEDLRGLSIIENIIAFLGLLTAAGLIKFLVNRWRKKKKSTQTEI